MFLKQTLYFLHQLWAARSTVTALMVLSGRQSTLKTSWPLFSKVCFKTKYTGILSRVIFDLKYNNFNIKKYFKKAIVCLLWNYLLSGSDGASQEECYGMRIRWKPKSFSWSVQLKGNSSNRTTWGGWAGGQFQSLSQAVVYPSFPLSFLRKWKISLSSAWAWNCDALFYGECLLTNSAGIVMSFSSL